MHWNQLLGHDQQRHWFQTALTNGRLATSFLLVGPEGIGKRTFAILLAKSLLCRQTPADRLEFCGACEDCVQVEAETHPDLIQVAKPPDRSDLPIRLLIGEGEKRMREGLCYDISLRPYSGQRKVAILDDADYLNAEGANCLLKTLEEPPLDSLLFLVGTSLQRQLPTIRSRCQAILFRGLQPDQLQQLLRQGAIDEAEKPSEEAVSRLPESELRALAEQAHGSLAKAKLIADPELREFRTHLHQMLDAPQIPITKMIKEVSGLVDAAGKEARARRDRMKLVFEMAAGFYRDKCLTGSQHTTTAGPSDSSPGSLTNSTNPSASIHSLLAAWNRCLSAIQQVERNANQAALIEAWTADLANP